jgi:hypothetical protein
MKSRCPWMPILRERSSAKSGAASLVQFAETKGAVFLSYASDTPRNGAAIIIYNSKKENP